MPTAKTSMQYAAAERALKQRMTAQRNIVLTRRDLRKNDGSHWKSLKEATVNSIPHNKIARQAAHILLYDTSDFSIRFLKNRTNTDLVSLRMRDEELHTILLKMGVEAGNREVNFDLGEVTIKQPLLRRPPVWDLGD